jgi:hypothetical protein
MSLNQTKALRFHNEILNINLAGLAITMGVYDKDLIENSVWHSARDVIEITKKAKDNRIGFVNFYPYNRVNKDVSSQIFYSCNIRLIENHVLKDDERANFFSGLFSTQPRQIPRLVYVFNNYNKIVGYALVGKVNIISSSQIYKGLGFKGYYFNRSDDSPIYLKNVESTC